MQVVCLTSANAQSATNHAIWFHGSVQYYKCKDYKNMTWREDAAYAT